MNEDVKSCHLNPPNIQLGRATGCIKVSFRVERANEHLASELAISFSGTVTPSPPQEPVVSTIYTLYYFATANGKEGA
jgi:hypothetical protein